MGAGHGHGPRPGSHPEALAGRLRAAFAVTAVILVAELAGGILTRSLALLSDAGHVFADLFALGISVYASPRPGAADRAHLRPTGPMFAGERREPGRDLGLILITAARRMGAPVAVESGPMGWWGGWLAANLAVVLLLPSHCKRQLNAESALIRRRPPGLGGGERAARHVGTGWFVIDPILSLIVWHHHAAP
jgi:cobalt-zinc-cadmium efflux system protein